MPTDGGRVKIAAYLTEEEWLLVLGALVYRGEQSDLALNLANQVAKGLTRGPSLKSSNKRQADDEKPFD